MRNHFLRAKGVTSTGGGGDSGGGGGSGSCGVNDTGGTNEWALIAAVGNGANTAQHEFTSSIDTTNKISCLLYTSPSPRDATLSRMPSSA